MHRLLGWQWKYPTYILESVFTSKGVKFNADDNSPSSHSDNDMDDERLVCIPFHR